jgi:hypothetical protein
LFDKVNITASAIIDPYEKDSLGRSIDNSFGNKNPGVLELWLQVLFPCKPLSGVAIKPSC